MEHARSIMVLLVVATSFSGCAADVEEDCVPERADGAASGHRVRIYVANETSEDACLEVELDGRIMVVEPVAGREGAGSEGRQAHAFWWTDASVQVEARDAFGGASDTIQVDVSQNGYIVVFRDENGIRIQAEDAEPQFL